MEGSFEGFCVGFVVGERDGFRVGILEGFRVGFKVGESDGFFDI